jgi:DNA-binding CsgD family transcriptional regulator
MGEIFVGRQAELSLLRGKLDAAAAGRGSLVLVEGAAGIGKTALLHQFLHDAGQDRALVASGDEAETGLPYGIVEQILARVRQPLPPPLLGIGEGADPLRVGAGLVDLLHRLQGEGPVILVVDDAHQADPHSMQALAFMLRRIRGSSVLAVLSTRCDAEEPMPGSFATLLAGGTGERLRLAGLDATALRAIAAAVGKAPLSLRAAARVVALTDGNALHAKALFEELPVEVLENPLDPLPAPRSYRMLVLARLAGCPPDAERLVVAASVLGVHCSLVRAAELAGLADPLIALERSIKARLLTEQPLIAERMISFLHPLDRAAVYGFLGPARRSALHARAARLVSSEAAALRHRVAAAGANDPALAEAVEAFAVRHAAAGAWTQAADSWLASARLSGSGGERARRVLEGVDCLLLAGSTGEASMVLAELRTGIDPVRLDYMRGRLALVEGRDDDARARLTRAWRSRRDDDVELTAAVSGQLALLELTHLRGSEAAAWARQGLVGPPGRSTAARNLVDVLVIGLAISGNAQEARATTAGLPEPAAATGAAGLDGLIGRGIARLWTDDLVAARRDLAAVVAATHRPPGPQPFRLAAMVFLAETEYRLGSWADAIVQAELAVSMTSETGQRWIAPVAHAVAALPLAGRGDLDSARAHLDAAQAWPGGLGTESTIAWVATAEATIAAAAGEWDAAAAALEPVVALDRRDGLDEPGCLPWRELYAEALIHQGAEQSAEAVLAPFEHLAQARGHRSSLVAAARLRGELEAARGRRDLAEAAFRAGLAAADELPMPFDRALLEAAYGRMLRRAGRRAEAIDRLQAARLRFAELQARPYLARCDRELAACGRAPGHGRDGRRRALTPQEFAVARLVASGLTNRQTAAELVVSIKTVEFHLNNVYAKLAITSRSQLRPRLQGAS